tara:strand:+ start:99015 stop:99749 length:735 start_codon:yes stop_codon:yes gene_type:complete
MTNPNMYEILDDLKWQIEAGVDEALSEIPNISFKKEKKSEIEKFEGNFHSNLNNLKNINDVNNYLKNFINCELKNISKNSISITGNLNSKIMMVCNIPNSEEDNKGEIIIEKNRDLFINILSSINLSLNDICLMPIIPWKTPGNRDLNDEEKDLLLPIIKKQIDIINPQILIFLGSHPVKYIFHKDEGMLSLRGKFLNYSNNDIEIPCMPILSPDFLIRRPEYKRETWNDLLTLSKKIKELNLK